MAGPLLRIRSQGFSAGRRCALDKGAAGYSLRSLSK
jgi:hypothetical protein